MSDESVPESRAYTHLKCGSETVVSGQPFETVSNPMSSMEQTYCSQCNAMFGIAEYEWSDTGETIADYYARHSKNATSAQRFLTSKMFMVLLIAALGLSAATGGFLMLSGSSVAVRSFAAIGALVVGAFIGMMLFVELCDKPITRKVCGVKDTRILR